MKVLAIFLLMTLMYEVLCDLGEPLVNVEEEGCSDEDIDRFLSKGVLAKVDRRSIIKKIHDLIQNNNVQDPMSFIKACDNAIQNMVGCNRKSYESKHIGRVFEKCFESLIKSKSLKRIRNVQESFDYINGNNLDDQLLLIESLIGLNGFQNPLKTVKSLKSSVDTYQLVKTKNIANALQKLLEALNNNNLKNPSEVLDAFEKSIKDLFDKQLPSISQNLLLSLVEDFVKLLRFKPPIKAIENLTIAIKKLVGDIQLSPEDLALLIQKAIDLMIKNNTPSLTEEMINSIKPLVIKPKIDGGEDKHPNSQCNNLLKYFVDNRSFKPSNLSNQVQDGCIELARNHNVSILEKVKDLYSGMLNPVIAKRSTAKIEVLFSLADALFDLLNLNQPFETIQSLNKLRNVLLEMSPESSTQFLRELFDSMKKNKISNPSEILNKMNSVVNNLLGDNLVGINENTLLNIFRDLLRLLNLSNKFEGLNRIEDVLRNLIVLNNNKFSSIPANNLAKILKVVIDEILSNKSIDNILPRLQNSNQLNNILRELGVQSRLTTTTKTTTTTTTTTTPTTTFSNNYPGLVNDYPISSLTNNGFRTVYSELYCVNLLSSTISNLRSQCDQNSVICAGGSKEGSNMLYLVACANCLSVLQTTSLNSPRLVGSAYWYFSPNLSFGFSPKSSITQNQADTGTDGDNQRLSWHLDLNTGGWRLGSIKNLNGDNAHRRYIFIRK